MGKGGFPNQLRLDQDTPIEQSLTVLYPLCHLWCLLMGHLVSMLGCFCITLLTWVGIGIDDARYFAIILIDSAIHFSMDIIDKIIIITKTSVFLTIALLSHHYAKCPTTIT